MRRVAQAANEARARAGELAAEFDVLRAEADSARLAAEGAEAALAAAKEEAAAERSLRLRHEDVSGPEWGAAGGSRRLLRCESLLRTACSLPQLHHALYPRTHPQLIHKQAIARLTADNLVFLTRAREAEAALGGARAQAAELRAALEDHRGPWFEEVAAAVEERVRGAMARADALAAELQSVREAAAAADEAHRAQRAELDRLLYESSAEAANAAARAA